MGSALIDHGVVRGGTRLLRDWFFALSFAAIGLSTNFRELAKYFKDGKPVILYVCGQSLNLCLTLAMGLVIALESTVVASKCAKVVAGAGSVKSSAGT